MQNGEKGFEPVWCPFYREDSGRSIYCEGITDESFLRLTFASGRARNASFIRPSTRGMRMTEEKAGKARRDPIEKASGNLEKALETISKRLLEQIKDGETPSRELGELAKVMKQAVEIRQELQEEHGGQETGVRVVFEREAEEFSE